MPQITLREEEPADEEFQYRVYASTRQEELAPLPWDEAQKEAFLRMQFTAQKTHYRTHYADSVFQVVMSEGVPIGRLYLHQGTVEFRIVDIALLPEWRGRGIGNGLLAEILRKADEAGLPVTLYVEGFNPAARLYERLGFVQGEQNGVYYFMERPVPSAVKTT